MIGHLQSRKAKIVANHFDYMHSIDRVSIAEKLNRELEIVDRTLPVLLEMNVGGEETKQGFPAWDRSMWDNLIEEITMVSNNSRLANQRVDDHAPIVLESGRNQTIF